MRAKRASRRPPPCEPGSIEQQLDMCETGPCRGDEILGARGEEGWSLESRMLHNFRVDMSEEGREGDELSGDEHSSGMQGSDLDQ